ncbi:hypothetical protein CY34DRAFT_511258 [Suillus luteus UH-Slu-Lm8-n1]|uniref:Uncharacterized protein n=1 Tax=Suillus luteus UH-Slu-Lm8-n1 TaxID=930992 RepID=A0A0C9ZGD1_9AGAM|nr:hypothetical protein CY34DRAFT_511258 [Suillus luteus UH-Slu-Lm8-n1]
MNPMPRGRLTPCSSPYCSTRSRRLNNDGINCYLRMTANEALSAGISDTSYAIRFK